MTDSTAPGPTDDPELEDLEPEPADAEKIKGGASEGSDPHGGTGRGDRG